MTDPIDTPTVVPVNTRQIETQTLSPTTGASVDVPSKPAAMGYVSTQGLLAREALGWGLKYVPKRHDEMGEKQLQRICQSLDEETEALGSLIIDDTLPEEESASHIAEIQALLEKLYDCPFGHGESLKTIAVILQAQLNNVVWSPNHVRLIEQAVSVLKARKDIDEYTIDEVNDMIEERGLDQFRGVISGDDYISEYRIEKIDK
jgi:hypothetical protein